MAQYPRLTRRGHRYWVLKVKGEGLTIYTTLYHPTHCLNRIVEVAVPTERVSFKGYMFGFYLPPYLFSNSCDYPPLFAEVARQHPSSETAHLFQALFFGGGVEGKVRRELGSLGIAHLLALSGLHLGLVVGGVLILLYPVYRFFHYRFFPYRNRYVDLGIGAITLSFLYLWITNAPPSLTRAVGMEVAAFLIWICRGRLSPLPLLGGATLIAFYISPSLPFSVGFLFSIVAVYLILLYFKSWGSNFWSWLLLSPYLQLAMVPLVHHFFPPISPYSILSPLLSLLFPAFYFGEVVLHILGKGGVLDPLLTHLLQLGENFTLRPTPDWLYYLYWGVLGVSYRWRWGRVLLPLLGLMVLI